MSPQEPKESDTTGIHEVGHHSSCKIDDVKLARMGKRPVLKVSESLDI